MKNNNLIQLSLAALFSLFLFSCKKYLDLKPDKKLAVPSSIKDLQALLDNNNIMNQKYPTYDEASSDNYFVPWQSYQAMSLNERKAYIWENYEYYYQNDWSQIYDVIYYANEVLHNLKNIERTSVNRKQWDNVKGSALVYRAEFFLKASWIFSKAYDIQTANTDLGIPLKVDPDFDHGTNRSSVKQSYEQIINDLVTASLLLPDRPLNVMRPSKQAAFSILSRTYLSMRNYDSAFKYANLSLNIHDELIDYNNLDSTSIFPFEEFPNKEIILNGQTGIMMYGIGVGVARVDSNLYNTYSNFDLRKKIFFRPKPDGFQFKGTYTGDFGNYFTGCTTSEMYLTRAECYAREGDIVNAMKDLNTVLRKRFVAGTFVDLTASNANEALNIVLAERRKELVFRGIRWMDIKRLNKEGANIILKRNLNGTIYTLQPNENRYALPLPADIISMTGMPQNPL